MQHYWKVRRFPKPLVAATLESKQKAIITMLPKPLYEFLNGVPAVAECWPEFLNTL